MKTGSLSLLILSLLLVTLLPDCQSQNFLKNRFKDRFYSVSVGTGQTAYFGELNYNNNIRRGFRNATAALEARLYDRFSARAEFTYFTMAGADRFAPDSTAERQRNLSFQSRTFELNLQAMFYLLDYTEQFTRRRAFEPFVAAGIGITRFNPTTQLDGETITLREIMTENVAYSRYVLVLPVGLGVKASLTKSFNFILEAGYRFTFTDYLDDVSGEIPVFQDGTTQQRLSNRRSEIPIVNQEAYDQLVPGGLRGNPDTNDAYLLVNFKLEYYLPILTRGQ